MQKMLVRLYHHVGGVLDSAAPNGVIPLNRITVVTAPWRGVHARTSAQGQEVTVKVSLGLVNMLYMTNRAVAGRSRIENSDDIASGDLVRELVDLLDHASAPVLPVRRGRTELSENQVRLAEMHTEWGEMFILAHELTHAHGIDRNSVATMPIFGMVEEDSFALEHAADLFATWLLLQMSMEQIDARAPTLSDEEFGIAALRLGNVAYAGIEATLHLMNMLELYDPGARPALHPTAHDRILFLRKALQESVYAAMRGGANALGDLLVDNAPEAIATAGINAKVVVRELDAVLERAGTSANDDWLDDESIDVFLTASRSGAMHFLTDAIHQIPPKSTRGEAALKIAARYYPRTESIYKPFWDYLESGEGGWGDE
jgi:hypothetical protein